jgi:hypothetical protein
MDGVSAEVCRAEAKDRWEMDDASALCLNIKWRREGKERKRKRKWKRLKKEELREKVGLGGGEL